MTAFQKKQCSCGSSSRCTGMVWSFGTCLVLDVFFAICRVVTAVVSWEVVLVVVPRELHKRAALAAD
eukprot:3305194-Rhodomonas_salina.1